MKVLLLTAALLCGLAHAEIMLSPYCYSGTIKMTDGSSKKVFLQLKAIHDSVSYSVETFTIGETVIKNDGTLTWFDRLEFSTTENEIDLNFSGTKVYGAFRDQLYRQTQGEFNLKLCKK